MTFSRLEVIGATYESGLGRKRDDMFWRAILLDKKVPEIHLVSDEASSNRHPKRLDSKERLIPPGDPSEEAELLSKMKPPYKRDSLSLRTGAWV